METDATMLWDENNLRAKILLLQFVWNILDFVELLIVYL